MTPERVGFIGAGNLAEAMIRGLITSGALDPGQIVISDVDQKRLIHVHETLGPSIAWSNQDNAARSEVLFLAVKPAQVAAVAEAVRPGLRQGQHVVSVAAGTSLARIRAAAGELPVLCRIMPNLAAAVRRATIGLFAEAETTDDRLGPIYALLSQLGRVHRIEDESLMSVVTALSGSAPAYYVMMADALVAFGVEQGMSRELATSMILGTMEGAGAWASGSRLALDELWRKVVTPGGTTQAGMTYYEERGFLEVFVEGLRRSTARARELGDA